MKAGDTPTCQGCGWDLCYLDRTMDDCPMCGTPIPVEIQTERCSQCHKPMNPIQAMMGSVCGTCVRKNHAKATSY
jgi:predicted RNA-binding Zn-ribbon protein involved in translation (DUF1610 family)